MCPGWVEYLPLRCLGFRRFDATVPTHCPGRRATRVLSVKLHFDQSILAASCRQRFPVARSLCCRSVPKCMHRLTGVRRHRFGTSPTARMLSTLKESKQARLAESVSSCWFALFEIDSPRVIVPMQSQSIYSYIGTHRGSGLCHYAGKIRQPYEGINPYPSIRLPGV